MSIRKRIWNGKQAWQVDLLLRKKRIRKQFPTRAEASEFELEMRKRSKEGTFAANGSKVRLKDIASDFLETLQQRFERKARMTAKHLHAQRGHVLNYILGGKKIRDGKSFRTFDHGLGDYFFDEISIEVVEEYFDRLQGTGISFKTIREIRNTLIRLLELARRRKYIAINPAKGLNLIPNQGTPRKKKIIPPPKLLIRMVIETANAVLSLQIKFAAVTGLRASEQWALRWKHIDFKRGYISVQTRLDELTKTEGMTKTEAGDREVPVSATFLSELLALKVASDAQADDLVFPGIEGRYRSHGSARDSFYRVVGQVMKTWPESEKRPDRPRWHDLRHFAISCWIEAGLPPKAIQEFAGHASLQMTMDLYGHLFPSADHQRAMDSVVTGLEKVVTGGTHTAHTLVESA